MMIISPICINFCLHLTKFQVTLLDKTMRLSTVLSRERQGRLTPRSILFRPFPFPIPTLSQQLLLTTYEELKMTVTMRELKFSPIPYYACDLEFLCPPSMSTTPKYNYWTALAHWLTSLLHMQKSVLPLIMLNILYIPLVFYK